MLGRSAARGSRRQRARYRPASQRVTTLTLHSYVNRTKSATRTPNLRTLRCPRLALLRPALTFRSHVALDLIGRLWIYMYHEHADPVTSPA